MNSFKAMSHGVCFCEHLWPNSVWRWFPISMTCDMLQPSNKSSPLLDQNHLNLTHSIFPSYNTYSIEFSCWCKFYLKESFQVLTNEDNEKKCWGCGLRILLPSNTSVFRCGWCGAITNLNSRGDHKDKSLQWRFVRDRFLVCIISLFILFIIGKLLNLLSLLFFLLYFPTYLLTSTSLVSDYF